MGELQAGNSPLPAPRNADNRSQRRKQWRLVCVAASAALIAACSGPSSTGSVIPSSASAHPSSKEASPASHQSSLSNPITRTVPNLLGMPLAAARPALDAAGFEKYSWVYGCYGSPEIGRVVKQVPGGGVQVARATYVKMFLQADNCTAIVPKVTGMSLSAAISRLQHAGFPHVHWIFECLGSSNGTVVIQSPVAGVSYATNKTVDLQAQADNC